MERRSAPGVGASQLTTSVCVARGAGFVRQRGLARRGLDIDWRAPWCTCRVASGVGLRACEALGCGGTGFVHQADPHPAWERTDMVRPVAGSGLAWGTGDAGIVHQAVTRFLPWTQLFALV